jgi:GNAT superfamily N-acetyltransferase
MINLLRTDSLNADFRELVKMLDADLRIRDGEDHAFYAQFNKIDTIKNVLVAYQDNVPAGCGAFKVFSEETVEIKRLFVDPQYRGMGIAQLILNELENWAVDLGFTTTVLETGQKQKEAIQLYHKAGYINIPNYGQFAGIENSICMQNLLKK